MKEPTVYKGAYPAGQPVESTERRQLAALFDQLLDGDVDQVGRVIHHVSGLVDGLRGHVARVFAVGYDFQVLPNGFLVPV